MNRREDFMDEIYDYMQGVKATVDGKEVDINMIMPTSSHAMERSDMEDEPATMYTNPVIFYSVVMGQNKRIIYL